jgi:hypothetical protein
MALERAAMTTELDRLASNSGQSGGGNAWEAFGASPSTGFSFPRGWIYLNMLKANELHDRTVARLSAADGVEPEFIGVDQRESIEKGLEELTGIDGYRYLFVKMLMPVLTSVESAMLFSQTRINQARISIALERSALASGGYPEALASLTGFKIPKDPCDGQLMRYRRLEGGYELWSVAKNRVDENGRTDPGITTPRDQPDWLWKVVKSPAAAKP